MPIGLWRFDPAPQQKTPGVPAAALGVGDQPPSRGVQVAAAFAIAAAAWATPAPTPPPPPARIAPIAAAVPSAWTRTGGAGNTGDGTFVASISATSSAPVAIGDLIAVAVTWGNNGFAEVVSDDLGNSYARVSATDIFDSPENQNLSIWFSIATVAGTPTVTLSFTGGNVAPFVGVLVDTFSGSDASSTTDGPGSGLNQASPTTATDALVSGTWTTSQPGDLIYSATHDTVTGSEPASAVGTGFTAAQDVGGSGGTTVFRSEYGTQAAPSGSTQGTWTAFANTRHLTAAIAITPGGSGGTVQPPPPRNRMAAADVQAQIAAAWQTTWGAQRNPTVPAPSGSAPPAGWTYRGGAFAGDGVQVTETVSLGPVASGDLVFVSATYDPGTNGATGTVVTDSLGNTYNQLLTANDPAQSQSLDVWWAIITVAGTPTIQVQLTPTPGTTAAAAFTIVADWFSGGSLGSVVDGDSIQVWSPGATGTDAVNSGSFATTQDGDLVYGVSVIGTSSGLTAGTGFTIATTASGGSLAISAKTEWLAQATHNGSTQVTWTTPSSADHIVAGVAVTLVAPAAAPVPPSAAKTAQVQHQTASTWQTTWAAQRGAQIAPVTLAYGQQPPRTAPGNAQVNLAWQPSWSTQSEADTAAWNVQPTRVPSPTATNLFTQLSNGWSVSWAAQRVAQIVPLTLAYGNQPPSSLIGPDDLARFAGAWRPDWLAQSEGDNAAWNVVQATVPAPMSPALAAQLSTAWTTIGSAAKPVAIVPLTLAYGAQPTPRAPLDAQRIAAAVSTWQLTWGAESEGPTAAWNVPITSQPVGVSALLVAQTASAWIVAWGAQHATPAIAIPSGDRPQLPAATPDSLTRVAVAWSVSWSAQRAAQIVPLTLGYGDRPQLSAASPDALTRFANAWAVSWDAQRPPTIVALTFTYGARPQLPAASPDLKAQVARVWAIDWSSARGATIAPTVVIVYGAQPPVSGALSATELAETLGAWASSWAAQTAAPNAAWNVILRVTVPSARQPIATLTTWQPASMPAARAVTIPITGVYGASVLSPADPELQQRIAGAWSVTWAARSAPVSLAWNVVVSVPASSFARAILDAWTSPVAPAQRARVIPIVGVYGSQPGPSYAQSTTLLSRIAGAWSVDWAAQSAAPSADWNIPPKTPFLERSAQTRTAATWIVSWGAQRSPFRVQSAAGDRPQLASASPTTHATYAFAWQVSWGAQTTRKIFIRSRFRSVHVMRAVLGASPRITAALETAPRASAMLETQPRLSADLASAPRATAILAASPRITATITINGITMTTTQATPVRINASNVLQLSKLTDILAPSTPLSAVTVSVKIIGLDGKVLTDTTELPVSPDDAGMWAVTLSKTDAAFAKGMHYIAQFSASGQDAGNVAVDYYEEMELVGHTH